MDENHKQQTISNYDQQNGNQKREGRSNSSTHTGATENGFYPEPMNTQNSNNRQQNNIQHTVAQQQTKTPQQNYTCSEQQETSWIGPQIQLQAIPVTFFNKDFSSASYALLERGSDSTQIIQKVFDALQMQKPKI